MAQIQTLMPVPSMPAATTAGTAQGAAPAAFGLLDALPGPVVVCSADGHILYSNRSSHEFIGDPVAVVGKPFAALFLDPDGDQRTTALLADLGDANQPACSREIELRWRLPDGREQTLCWTAAWAGAGAATGADEAVLVFSGVQLGSTQQLSMRVRQAEQQSQAMASATADGIVMADDDGTIRSVNPATVRLFGYPAAELVGQRIDMLLDCPDQQLRRDWLDRVLYHPALRRRGSDNEFSARRRNGDTFPCDLSLVERTIGGHHRHILVLRNASARRRSEQEMARMRLDLKSIIDSMPSVLVGVDLNCAITSWNKQAEHRTGVPATEALGKPFRTFFPDLEERLGEVRDAVHSHRQVDSRRITLKEGGRIRHLEVMVYPLLARGTEGAVIRVDDVSARVQLEQAMVQSEKMRSLGGLAAGMAHEINNPLGVIAQSSQNAMRRLSAELERNHQLADELGVDFDRMTAYLDARGIPGFLEAIRDAAARASHIVTDMLSFSRGSDAGQTACSLEEMAETALRLAAADYELKTLHRFREVRLLREYALDLPTVVCDPTGVEQVILNLVRNATQAMALAGVDTPTIVLRTERVTTQAGERVRLSVRDNGPGIEEAVRRQVFEPFFTTKDVGIGTGLGLSVSYFIMTHQHRGSLSLQSYRDGACFTLELPLDDPQ